ncbi:hypothetical protein B0O99DRAFT_685707 [Bisporella sp. PMI_857]|nr:hypothetical protein B0O99DRAFT_685707 [Bisporella sp. PMI_857]
MVHDKLPILTRTIATNEHQQPSSTLMPANNIIGPAPTAKVMRSCERCRLIAQQPSNGFTGKVIADEDPEAASSASVAYRTARPLRARNRIRRSHCMPRRISSAVAEVAVIWIARLECARVIARTKPGTAVIYSGSIAAILRMKESCNTGRPKWGLLPRKN